MRGQRHLIQCRCTLPHLRKLDDPPFHEFPVFSVLDDSDRIRVKFVQCPNCGIVHRVTDITKSEIINGKEDLRTVVDISDIKAGMNEQLSSVLESNECDVSVWENVKFVIDERQWGSMVTLTSESIDGMRQGKYIRILGEKLFKVDQFAREEYVTKR